MQRLSFVLFILASLAAGAQGTAQDTARQIPLWPKGAPGFENKRNEPEQAQDYWVKNIHNPSITVYLPPKEKATGAAVVIFPGGGHRLLVFNAEGRDPARFLNSLGIAAFIVKYRLFREDSNLYSLDKEVKQDAYRAMRLVRSHAAEWNISPDKVGTLSFSAGGEVANIIAYASGKGDPQAPDPIDRLDGKPNFQLLVYPGPLGVPTSVPADAPPAFLIAANDDECCSAPLVDLLPKFRAAKVPVELHLFQAGGHAFNMGLRKEQASFKHWPNLLIDWLGDNGWLKPR